MGFLFRLFSRRSQCPLCFCAAEAAFGRVECANPVCRNFSREFHDRLAANHKTARSPRTERFRAPDPVSIRYRNYLGEGKIFTASRASLYAKNNHIMAVIEPYGGSVSLCRDRITNLGSLGPVPQRGER